MEFKKNKKYTKEEKDEIVGYSIAYGIKEASVKYGIWPDNIRYWANSELREKVKAKQREQKLSEETKERKRLYSAERYSTGEAKEYRKQWYGKLSEDKKTSLNEYSKQHRLDNIDKYKERSKQQYLKEREEGKLRDRYANDPLHKLRCNIREHVSDVSDVRVS
jgi:transposase-like protein